MIRKTSYISQQNKVTPEEWKRDEVSPLMAPAYCCVRIFREEMKVYHCVWFLRYT